MPRVPTIRHAMVALSSMILVAAVLVPLAGIASASKSSTTCSPSEGTGATCWLDIAAPSSVRTGLAFTVQVRVTTDSTKATVATNDPCGSKAPITLSLSGEPYSATKTVTARAGIATFSFTIPSGDAGTYGLFASGPGGDAAPATTCGNYNYKTDETELMAVDIPLDAPIAPCPPDTNCVQATSGSGTQATLIADLGSAWSPKFVGATFFGRSIPGDNCTSGPPIDPKGVLGFTLTFPVPAPTQTGVIILALDATQVTKGIGLFNVCWHQTIAFKSVTGAQVTTGDLPNCAGRDQIAPCVLSKTSGQHNVAFLSILTPANDPDPHTYGH